jgi:transposase
MEEWMDIKNLYRQGVSIREIARQTGRSRNTVARIVHEKAPQPFQKVERKSLLEPYKAYLKERYQNYGISSVRLLEEIKAQGYSGSLDVVQRYIKQIKQEQVVSAKATLRFETPPGLQAQADWAHVGEDAAGKIYAFVMVLSFSRTLFVTFTRSMQLSALVQCHQAAFEALGGIPESILYDNMAQVKHGDKLNPLFADFSAHYGFAPPLSSAHQRQGGAHGRLSQRQFHKRARLRRI